MHPFLHSVLAGACILANAQAQSQINVRFEQAHYFLQPGQSLDLNIVVDPIEGGLFSYGVLATPESGSYLVFEQISVPSPLNFNGVLGAGALTDLSASAAGVKGTVDLQEGNPAFYENELLAILRVRDISENEGESTTLNLDFFNTIGPAETLFVNGLGNDIDGQIQFSGTTITIVPEPSVTAFWIAGLLIIPAWKLSKRNSSKVLQHKS